MELNFSQIDLKQEGSGRERVYFALILVLIVVMFARWFYVPKLTQMKTVKVEIRNSLLQIGTLKQFAQLKLPEVAAPLAQRSISAGTRFEKAVEEHMRSQQQVVAEIIKALSTANALKGVTMNGINLGAEVNKGAYGAVPLTIDLEGKYSGVTSYLSSIERLGKLITIDNIELKVKDSSGSVVQARVVMNIYLVHAAGEGTAAPQAASAQGQPVIPGAAPAPK